MTSLAKQIEQLRTAVSAQLGVERPHVSLLFDKKAASSVYVENAFQIGCAGLEELRKIDPKIAIEEQDLFDEAAANVQRILLTKKENVLLDQKIERVIYQLSPYLHHFAAKQVLEWLIFRYQVQSFSAEVLFIAFLPYHTTNIFGRLLSILDLKRAEYQWTKEYADMESPIPLMKLVNFCTSRNHSLLSQIHNHIERIRELFDSKYIDSKLPHLFTFYTSIIVHLVAVCTVTEDLLSKILPFLGKGLVSDIVSLRLVCLVVISQLCTAVKLTSERLYPVIKLILLKMDNFTVKESIDTLVVICQHQDISNFSLNSQVLILSCVICFSFKTALKIAKKDANLSVSTYIKTLSVLTDVRPFLNTFALSYIPMLFEDGILSTIDSDVENYDIVERHGGFTDNFTDQEEKVSELCSFCISCLDLCMLNDHISKVIFNSIYESLSKRKAIAKIPSTFWKYVRTLAFRFASFNLFFFKWHISLVKSIIKLEDSVYELIDTIKTGDRPLSEAGLEKLMSSAYLNTCEASDLARFCAKAVAVALTEGAYLKTAIKDSLSQLLVDPDFASSLLLRCSEFKTLEPTESSSLDCFETENEKEFEARRAFVLEILIANSSLKASAMLLQQLHKILKESVLRLISSVERTDENGKFLKQLVIRAIVCLVRNPNGYSILAEDLHLDTYVDIIRHTRDHSILRDCLQLLTCVVSVSPKKVLVHLMSIYTFMGDGILKKDNDLTLSVIEETLNVLFSTVMTEKDYSFHDNLVTTCRLFAASVIDIPAHRRDKILRAIARSVGPCYLWAVIAVFFEHYCISWPRKSGLFISKILSFFSRTSAELYEEMSNVLVSEYDAIVQFSCAADIIKYVIKLGGDFMTSEEQTRSVVSEEGNLLKIFDRRKLSIQKLRHYRFSVLGWIVRLLESQEFEAKLSAVSDESYDKLVEIAKHLLLCSVELDDFVIVQTLDSEKSNVQQKNSEQSHLNNYKYWIVVSSRAGIIIEKFQNVLPSRVCGNIVVDVLEQTTERPKLRDLALKFLNNKLLQDDSNACMMKANDLENLVRKFNSWLQPVGNEIDVDLCQKSAYTLRLIARNISSSMSFERFCETLKLTVKLLSDRSIYDEVATGSLLLLAGELMRFQRVKNAVLYSNTLTTVCTEILFALLENHPTVEIVSKVRNSLSKDRNLEKRKSLASHDTNDNYFASGDALLVCSLICLQRILENFAEFVYKHVSTILIVVSRLCQAYNYLPIMMVNSSRHVPTISTSSAAQQRIFLIVRALSKIELRLVLSPFDEACKTLMAEPAAVSILFKIFSSMNELKSRNVLLKYIVEVCNVFLRGLDIRTINMVFEKKEMIDNAEISVIDSFLGVVDNLTELEFRMISKSIDMRLQESVSPDANFEIRYRLITIFRFLNQFYDSYKNLSLPHFGRFFSYLPNLFAKCNAHLTGDLIEDTRSLVIRNCGDSVIAAVSLNDLLIALIDFVKNCARHRTFFTLQVLSLRLSFIKFFFCRERAKSILDPLINELENTKIPSHEIRCVPHLAECLYNVIDCQNEMLMDVINKIVLKTRSERSKVRYRTLLILERLFERMGNAVAPALPSVLPFLTELLEDDNKKVEMQCDAVINILRKNFGEEIAEGYA
ncbi:unnamed protein product [Thelazia callipaeda]|uniref:HEAT repeat-containing protein 1 n=1 Tax=Thelazia callipaeda TaxID=103827 RepID=A0A0N5CZU4_THECL|nr:unnamed protein product [Thelazia callipaeda]